jgi:GNAT superfamily N-acetyltransferase
MGNLERLHGKYTISDNPERLDLKAIHAYLRRAYWSEEIPLETLERALAGSLGIGVYDNAGAQVGFARFITDCATFCYVCDVYVLDVHRGQGLAAAMMAMAVSHPKLQDLRRWNLVTRDAHGVYAPFGFTALANAERYMERLTPGIYKRRAATARI